MKALWISERFPPQRGGVANAAARQVRSLAPELERLDVLNLTQDLAPGRVEVEELGDARVHRLGRAPRSEESLRLLSEVAGSLCDLHRYDLVHGFYAVFAGYVAVLLARERGLPAVISLRGNDVDLGAYQGSRAYFLSFALTHATAITGVSREILKRARALSGRAEGLHWVANSVDAELFCPGEPDPGHLAALESLPRPWIGFAGEARFKKGLPILLDLAEELARQGRGTVVVIGGLRDDEREMFRRWRASDPLAAARLCELPYQRDLPRLLSAYRAMDLFVFPSLWDGLPNALLEVMACARPVLATRAGGIVDVVEHDDSGVLVSLDALDSFADQVDAVLALPEHERQQMGARARARVCEHFTIAQERAALLDLYTGLVGDQGGAGADASP